MRLRQIEVQTSQGKSLALARQEADISEQKRRGECLEIFSLRQAQVAIRRWQTHDHRRRPHYWPGYRPPAPAMLPDSAEQRTMSATML